MTHQLENILTKIHRELIVSNMETLRLKEMQREVFKLEDQYKVFEQRADELENKINKWVEDYAQDNDDIEALLQEKIPHILKAQKNTDDKLTKIYNELESYKGYGLVMEYE